MFQMRVLPWLTDVGGKVKHGLGLARRDHRINVVVQKNDKKLARLELGLHTLQRAVEREGNKAGNFQASAP